MSEDIEKTVETGLDPIHRPIQVDYINGMCLMTVLWKVGDGAKAAAVAFGLPVSPEVLAKNLATLAEEVRKSWETTNQGGEETE